MQKSFAILIALLGSLALVSAFDRELIANRFTLAQHSVENRALKTGKLARRGATINNGAGLTALLTGLATGLQFAQGLESDCFNAMSTSILASDQLIASIKQIYDPRKLPEVLLINKEITDAVAQITATCNVDKVVNTFTKAIGEGSSTFVARIAGGMIKQIPDEIYDYLKSSTDSERGLHIGKLVQIVADWSI